MATRREDPTGVSPCYVWLRLYRRKASLELASVITDCRLLQLKGHRPGLEELSEWRFMCISLEPLGSAQLHAWGPRKVERRACAFHVLVEGLQVGIWIFAGLLLQGGLLFHNAGLVLSTLEKDGEHIARVTLCSRHRCRLWPIIILVRQSPPDGVFQGSGPSLSYAEVFA